MLLYFSLDFEVLIATAYTLCRPDMRLVECTFLSRMGVIGQFKRGVSKMWTMEAGQSSRKGRMALLTFSETGRVIR